MKTTLEIPDELYRQAKVQAAHENRKKAGAVLLTANREDFIRFESQGLRLLTP